MNDVKEIRRALEVYADSLIEFYDQTDLEKRHFRTLVAAARAYVELVESVDAEHWLHDDCECHHKGLAVAWHTAPCVLAEVKRLIYRLKAAVVPGEADK